MFYAAEALLLARGLTFASHRAVISTFGNPLVKTGQLPPELHQWQREAFDKGQLSDCEFLSGIGDPEVQAIKAKAAKFLEQATALLHLKGTLKEREP